MPVSKHTIEKYRFTDHLSKFFCLLSIASNESICSRGNRRRRIVQDLVKRNIPVRALVRDLQQARAVLPEAAELVVGDVLKPGSLSAAIADSTVLLCATGQTQL